MSLLRRALVPALAALAGVAGFADQAAAAPTPGAVYVLSNQQAGNAVLVFDRAADGTLTPAGSYATGGAGTSGGLGSQGAVTLDPAGRFLYAVNAGSDTVSSFLVGHDGLSLVDVVDSGGTTPTSVTVHGDLVYVLNAGGAGGISGFTTNHGDLTPIAGSTRPLSSAAAGPGQVSFTPDGGELLVTEKATQLIDVFPVAADGTTGPATVVSSAGVTPFGFGFDNKSHVIVSEAFGGAPNGSAVSSYSLDGVDLGVVSASVPTTETAACWIAVTGNGKFAYAGNAGTASVTGYRVAPDGSLSILDADGKTGSAAAGITDLAMSVDSHFLYARTGNGTVTAWAIAADGSLSDVGAFAGLPAGAAGIAAR
jgi:6-phosphogluconolactonase (cycloisomerase 2 family)